MITGEYASLTPENQGRANILCKGCKHRGLNGDCKFPLHLDGTSLTEVVKEGKCGKAATGNFLEERTLIENEKMLQRTELVVKRP